MSRKLVSLTHHLASGCCMWSGIEDMYASNTNQTLPEAFLFILSSFGETVFLKTGDRQKPYMFSFGDGRTRKTYDSLKEILGLNYRISEGRTLSHALKTAKHEIDNARPVILGPLDMYHLPYLKMYHQTHIPMHYICMVGYDEEKECVLIYDCDRPDLIELPLSELIEAWQIEKNAVGDKNGLIRFTISDRQKTTYELTDLCLRQKASRQLCSKPDFVGINAFHKIAKELPTWQELYSPTDYKNILASLTETFGMVPKLPNELSGLSEEEDISYQANYDRISRMLLQMGEEFGRTDWIQAGALFEQCGRSIETIKREIIAYVCQDENHPADLPGLFLQTGQYARQAYQIIANHKEES